MELSLSKIDWSMSRLEIRAAILKVQEKMFEQEGKVVGKELEKLIPTKHTFCEGMYVRECFIPKGQLVIGMIHKKEHPVFLLKGRAQVITESNGFEDLEAPYYGVSPAGTKRIVLTLEDTVWVTTHATDKKTREECEKDIAAETYEDMEGIL